VEGRTAMGTAANAGQWELVEKFLDYGANPLAEDCTGRSPLANAVRDMPGSTVTKRMLNMCSPGALSQDLGVLTEAMRVGDTSLLERCLGVEAKQQPSVMIKGWPLLWWVSYFGQTSLACTWVRQDPDAARWRDGSSRVLLHWIGVWGCASVPATNAGANAMAPMSDLVAPLAEAIGGLGDADIDGFTPLTLAARSGNMSLVYELCRAAGSTMGIEPAAAIMTSAEKDCLAMGQTGAALMLSEGLEAMLEAASSAKWATAGPVTPAEAVARRTPNQGEFEATMDPDFRPGLASLSGDAAEKRLAEHRSVVWRRAREVCGPDAVLFDVETPLDVQPVQPGPLGGAFFWCAVSTSNNAAIRAAFPDGGEIAPGMYRVVLPMAEGPKEVYVDDWIPCLGTREVDGTFTSAPAYGSMGRLREIWSLIYSKACAKAVGSYLAAFTSPLSGTPAQLDQTMEALGFAGLDTSVASVLTPAVQLAGIIGNERAPFLGASSADAAPALAEDLSLLANELSLAEEDVVHSRGEMSHYLVSPSSETKMSIKVGGAEMLEDLTATVKSCAGNPVATLTAANMMAASERVITLTSNDGPYRIALSTAAAQQEGMASLDVQFAFDREDIMMEMVDPTDEEVAGAGDPNYAQEPEEAVVEHRALTM